MLHVTRDKSRGKVASRAIYLEIDKLRAKEREEGTKREGPQRDGTKRGRNKRQIKCETNKR